MQNVTCKFTLSLFDFSFFPQLGKFILFNAGYLTVAGGGGADGGGGGGGGGNGGGGAVAVVAANHKNCKGGGGRSSLLNIWEKACFMIVQK